MATTLRRYGHERLLQQQAAQLLELHPCREIFRRSSRFPFRLRDNRHLGAVRCAHVVEQNQRPRNLKNEYEISFGRDHIGSLDSASVGAIAATRPAEYGRRTGRNPNAFEQVAALPKSLGDAADDGHSRLIHLITPGVTVGARSR